MAKTIVTFKVLRDHRIVRKNIPIEHDFKVIPPTVFNGATLPAVSVEDQVMQYLDEMDKAELMIENGFDVIIDYYPKKVVKKRDEVAEFIDFCKPYIRMFPHLERPFSAIMAESKDVLFGRNKSNETKMMEMLNMVSVAFKASQGTISMVERMIDNYSNNKLSNE